MATINLNVNGKKQRVDVDQNACALGAARAPEFSWNQVWMRYGTMRYTIHLDGAATFMRASVSSVEGKEITTIEGLSEHGDHPVQQAWLEHDVPGAAINKAGKSHDRCGFAESKSKPQMKKLDRPWMAIFAVAAHYLRIKAAVKRQHNLNST